MAEAKTLGRAMHLFQLLQQQVGHPAAVRPLHHHIDGRRGEDAVILRLEGGRGDVGQVGPVAPQLDTGGGIAVEAAAGLTHAIQALVVEFGLQAAVQGLLFNADGFRVKDTVHQIGLEHDAESNIGVFGAEIFAGQGKLVLDAADVHRQHPVGTGGAQVHPQVSTVQAGQLAGEGGHIRALGIAAFQHQGQYRGIGGRTAQRRVAQMDGDAAAIEFFGIQRGQIHTGRQLLAFKHRLFLRIWVYFAKSCFIIRPLRRVVNQSVWPSIPLK